MASNFRRLTPKFLKNKVVDFKNFPKVWMSKNSGWVFELVKLLIPYLICFRKQVQRKLSLGKSDFNQLSYDWMRAMGTSPFRFISFFTSQKVEKTPKK